MKKTATLISVLMSLILALNVLSSIPAYAVQIAENGIDDNSFLLRSTSYGFGLSTTKSFTSLEVRYYGRNAGNSALTYETLATYNFSVPTMIAVAKTISTTAVNDLLPYYDLYNDSFLRDNLVFIVHHTDNTETRYSIKSNVLKWNISDYEDFDTTFSYTDQTNNSFISFGTGSVWGAGNVAQNTYNCLSYSIHAEDDGWLWPFNGYSTPTAVTYWLYNNGYTQNTSPNHDFCHVIAYGKYNSVLGGNDILHFAKVTDWSSNGTPIEINSKWGELEVVHSTNIDPFSGSVYNGYGSPLLYYNKSNNNTSSICYNAETNTYYDSNYKTWNASTHSYDYIDVLFNTNNPSQTSSGSLEYKECPSELSKQFEIYKKRILSYEESLPGHEAISYVITDDGKGAAEQLFKSVAPYKNQVFNVATQQGYYDNDCRIAQFIITNTLHLNTFYAKPDEYLNAVKSQLQLASNAIYKKGPNISQKECQELQNLYGYLIAPALNEIGKIELLQIDEKDVYQNADQIIEYCNSFK